jgi:hypothetical protein
MIRDIGTLQQFVNVDANSAFEVLLPFLKEAEKTISELISPEQMAAVKTAYTAATSDAALSADMLNLINYIRPVLANYAMQKAVPRLQFAVSTSGALITSNEFQKTAFSWQIRDAVDGYMNAGDGAADDLLEFLEANKTTYTLFANSSAYTEFKNCLVFNTAQFNAIRPINNSRRVFRLMKPYLMDVQDLLIKSAISEAYLNELLLQSKNNALTADNKTVLDLLQKAMCNMAASLALLEFTVTIDHDRATISTSRSTEIPSGKESPDNKYDKRIALIAAQWRSTGESYLKSAIDYLNKNASVSRYATFFSSSAYVDPSTDTRFKNDTSWGIVSI